MQGKWIKIILIILAAIAAIACGYMLFGASEFDDKVKIVVPDSMVE